MGTEVLSVAQAVGLTRAWSVERGASADLF